MDSQVKQYTSRAVVRLVSYMTSGIPQDYEEYLRLTRLAMQHHEEMICNNCGGVQIPCRIKNIGINIKGYICTDCRQITINGRVYRHGMPRRVRAC